MRQLEWVQMPKTVRYTRTRSVVLPLDKPCNIALNIHVIHATLAILVTAFRERHGNLGQIEPMKLRVLTLDDVTDELLAECGLTRGAASTASYRCTETTAVLMPTAKVIGRHGASSTMTSRSTS